MKNDTKKLSDLLTRVEDFRRRYALYAGGESLLVALSGGKDSVCLLRILAEQRERLGLRLCAAHVHHGLRESAERDLNFCKDLCQRLSVPFHFCRVDAAALAEKRGISVEEAGRELRYDYFFRLQQELGMDRILTAHTASDQGETVLMRLVRGGALRGLCGIPPKRGDIRRPLLCLSSHEVLFCLRAMGQDWVEDETNEEEEYCRNRVRNTLLPLIKKENPAWEETLFYNSLALRGDLELLETLSRRALESVSREEGLRLEKEGFRALCSEAGMEGLAARAVLRAASTLGEPSPSALCTEALCRLALEGQAGRSMRFGGAVLRVEQKEIVFSLARAKQCEDYCLPVEEGAAVLTPLGAKITRGFSQMGENYKNINKMLMIMKINSATIRGAVVARSRAAGDRIVINGMKKNVKKLLCDLKLPTQRRAQIPVIADSEGILWVPGVGLCDRARPREGEAFFIMEFQWSSDSEGSDGDSFVEIHSPDGRDKGE